MNTKTVYISIGNSDDKLTQAEWAHLYVEVDAAIDETCTQIHGRWLSASDSPWQNACWCVVPLDDQNELKLREALALAASAWRQDSIAWAEATTEFISPAAPGTSEAKHGYTGHGHPCCGEAKLGARPASIARCGGPGMCEQCADDRDEMHAGREAGA